MKTINLLPKPEQRELQMQFLASQVFIFWFWVIVSLLVLYGFAFGIKTELKKNITETDRAIGTQKQVLRSQDNEKLKTEVVTLNNNIESIKKLRVQHYFWSNVLVELAQLSPADFKIDYVDISRETNKIAINGVSGTRESVLKFWSNVHKSTLLKNINFPLSNLEQPKDTPFSFIFYVDENEIKKSN